MVDVNFTPPSSGAVLASVTAGPARVTVYSDAGLTQAVTLPYTLPSRANTTLYVGSGGAVRAVVTDTAGTKTLAVANGVLAAGTDMTFRPRTEYDAVTDSGT